MKRASPAILEADVSPATFSLHCKRCGHLIPRGTRCVVVAGPRGEIHALYHRIDCSAGRRALWRVVEGGRT